MWTRQECAPLEASGFWAQERLELIDGELISKRGKKRPHTNALAVMQAFLIGVFGAQFVNSAAPIDVAPEDNPTNEPEPDLIVLARPSRDIRSGNPQPSEIRLLVEISDAAVRFDLTVKARLYARYGIADYCGRYSFAEDYRASESARGAIPVGHSLRRRGEPYAPRGTGLGVPGWVGLRVMVA